MILYRLSSRGYSLMHYSSFPHFLYVHHPVVPVPPLYHPAFTAIQPGGQNVFPDVDIRKFHLSATRFRQILTQTDFLISKIVASDDFARDLMEAAQASDKAKVDRLIRSTGVTIAYTLSYTPDGLRLDITNSDSQIGCCDLRLLLRW